MISSGRGVGLKHLVQSAEAFKGAPREISIVLGKELDECANVLEGLMEAEVVIHRLLAKEGMRMVLNLYVAQLGEMEAYDGVVLIVHHLVHFEAAQGGIIRGC